MMTGTDDQITRAKRAMRGSCEARRAVIGREAGYQAGAAAVERFLAALTPPAAATPSGKCVVAGYWPMRHEFDARPLLTALFELGHVCALPVVVARDQPLLFRQWRPGAELVEGAYGTLVPRREAPQATPGMLLVPMLAYDDNGYRLGYGGGFYDRTLAALKTSVAVGCAYDAQRIDAVPITPYDQRLDWIVTEKRTLKIT